jgi:hypothetical protein
MLHQIFNGVCDYKYKDILVRLNFLTLHLRRRRLDALFLINVFKGKISCSSVFDTVSLRIITRSVRDYSTFTVHHNFRVSPSARFVSAANAVCRSIDIFNKDVFGLLISVSFLNKNKCSLFLYQLFVINCFLLYFILSQILMLACN